MKKPIGINRIPKEVDIFGRKIKTVIDNDSHGRFGEARYGVNEIMVNDKIMGKDCTEEENKLTYLHELTHFILTFTGFDDLIGKGEKINLEQLVELIASGIYQYEKSAKY